MFTGGSRLFPVHLEVFFRSRCVTFNSSAQHRMTACSFLVGLVMSEQCVAGRCGFRTARSGIQT
jgi:hypothetical protein